MNHLLTSSCFYRALRRWRRGNIALITTLPVLVSTRCNTFSSGVWRTASFLIKTRLNKQHHSEVNSAHVSHSGSPKCGQYSLHRTTKKHPHSSPLKGVHLLTEDTHRQMTAQRCPCQLLVFKETFCKHSQTATFVSMLC